MRYEAGEIRAALARDLGELLERVVNLKKDRRHPYYILVTLLPTDHFQKIHTRATILKKKPKPMLNSILVKVDNRTGEIDFAWCFPKDDPLVVGIDELDAPNVVERVIDDVKRERISQYIVGSVLGWGEAN